MLKPHAKDPNRKSETARWKEEQKNSDSGKSTFGAEKPPRPKDWKDSSTGNLTESKNPQDIENLRT